MTKTLLIIAGGAALVSFLCFALLGAVGGLGAGWSPARLADWGERGAVVTRDLPFSGAERLDIAYPAEITFTQGAQARFTVTGPKGLVDALRLDGGILDGPDGPGLLFHRHRHGRLRIDIVSPDTREFRLSGAEKLDLRNFDQDSLVLECAGAADVEGQGRAKRLDARLSGAGRLNLARLAVDDAVISISGAGDAIIDPHASADVSIAGAGHVELETRPLVLQTHISGFGTVSHP
jgi:hypothetical protein